ncbi:hypothetical protein KGQ71_03675 [Patescibacteria group bacterium]|nr:hypothetical protein [Patescibacteria group bacterium]
MSTYPATVIKTGNSYALRLPKRYIEDANLHLGQKVTIPLPIPKITQNRQRVQSIFRQLQELNAYRDLTDPAAWQRELRQDRPLPGRE